MNVRHAVRTRRTHRRIDDPHSRSVPDEKPERIGCLAPDEKPERIDGLTREKKPERIDGLTHEEKPDLIAGLPPDENNDSSDSGYFRYITFFSCRPGDRKPARTSRPVK